MTYLSRFHHPSEQPPLGSPTCCAVDSLRGTLSQTLYFPEFQGPSMQGQVPGLSSQSTDRIIVFRNGVQTSVRAKFVDFPGQFY